MSNGYDSRAIANIFVRKAMAKGDRLTIMSLLKFVYFAHGWVLGHTGRPLICHEVEAWKYGPVVSEVYEAFRPQGIMISGTVDSYANPSIDRLSPDERSIVNSIYAGYSVLPPFRLSAITHDDGTPWAKYRHQNYARIPNKEIEQYYKGLIARMENSQ